MYFYTNASVKYWLALLYFFVILFSCYTVIIEAHRAVLCQLSDQYYYIVAQERRGGTSV